MWNTTEFDFNIITPGTKVEANFYYEGDKEIEKVKVSCGCTLAKFNKKEKVINAVYTAGELPKYMVEKGIIEFQVNKSVFVTYTDGEEETLKIKGTVKNNDDKKKR